VTETRPPIVAAIIVYDGLVLLVRRRVAEGSLSWQFPAGASEADETAFDTATREVREEVGLAVRPILLIGERQHPATGRQMAYVGCIADNDDASVLDDDELAELAWCDWSDVNARIPTGLYDPVAAYLRVLLRA
jgi:8-oxo-dGTP diphosphatase